jgi:hypothetical protein
MTDHTVCQAFPYAWQGAPPSQLTTGLSGAPTIASPASGFPPNRLAAAGRGTPPPVGTSGRGLSFGTVYWFAPDGKLMELR